MKKGKTQFAIFIISLLLISIGNNSNAQEVKIGKQTWATVNLDVSTFRNGDPIPEAKTDDEWEKAAYEGKPMFCYYNFNAANGKKYGKLYNWFAVNDKRGLAPKGWHIPKDTEWKELVDFTGGIDDAGKKLKSTSGWAESEKLEKYANGTNESGFSGLPGGVARPGGSGYGRSRGFYGINEKAMWWSAEGYNESNDAAAMFGMSNYTFKVEETNYLKSWGFSIRCIKN